MSTADEYQKYYRNKKLVSHVKVRDMEKNPTKNDQKIYLDETAHNTTLF